MYVATNNNIWVLVQLIFFSKGNHAIIIHCSRHYDLDLFKGIDILNHLFGFVLAMGALWVKQHQHHCIFFGQFIFIEYGAVRLQQFHRWKGGKTFVGWE